MIETFGSDVLTAHQHAALAREVSAYRNAWGPREKWGHAELATATRTEYGHTTKQALDTRAFRRLSNLGYINTLGQLTDAFLELNTLPTSGERSTLARLRREREAADVELAREAWREHFNREAAHDSMWLTVLPVRYNVRYDTVARCPFTSNVNVQRFVTPNGIVAPTCLYVNAWALVPFFNEVARTSHVFLERWQRAVRVQHMAYAPAPHTVPANERRVVLTLINGARVEVVPHRPLLLKLAHYGWVPPVVTLNAATPVYATWYDGMVTIEGPVGIHDLENLSGAITFLDRLRETSLSIDEFGAGMLEREGITVL